MDPNFFQTIEEHFVRLRGAPLILSPSDWHVAATWWERRIPLSVILRAIEDVFATARGRGRGPVQSLAYCRHAVEKEFSREIELSLGMPDRGSPPGPGQLSAVQRVRTRSERLAALRDRASGATREELTDALRCIVAGLARLESGNASPAATEEALLTQEQRVAGALLEGLPPDERLELDAVCARRVAPYREQMNADVLESTLRRCRETEIRRRHRLPRLSLLVD